MLWGPIAAGSVFIVMFAGFVAMAQRSHSEPPFVARHDFPIRVMERGNVVVGQAVDVPQALDAKRANVVADDDVRPLAAAPAAEGNAPILDRENFGTAVEFARNPREAARLAGQERKLTFVLHVSGNFEEAAFT
jgi:hypothetical protein